MSQRAVSAVLAAALLGAGAPLLLGGCGFTPLYASAAPTEGLTHIQVNAPHGRVGYLLGESLNDDLGGNPSGQAVYKLDLVVAEGRAGHGLNAIGVSQRFEVDLTVSYTLTSLATGQVAHKGTVTSIASYDSADQPYAGVAAGQDTEGRVAADAAQQIEVQLAAWLSSHPSS